jgi:hypothetical protein
MSSIASTLLDRKHLEGVDEGKKEGFQAQERWAEL